MAFQSFVNIKYAAGVAGELAKDEPTRVNSHALDSNGGTIGRMFTASNSTGVATQGGTATPGTSYLLGLLVGPKEQTLIGTTAGTLTPTLTLPGNAQGEFLQMGQVWVTITGTCNLGDIVQYHTATGVLSCKQPGSTADASNALIPNAVVTGDRVTGSGGLTRIRFAGFTA